MAQCMQAEYDANAQQDGAAMQWFFRRMRGEFGIGGEGRSGQTDGQETGIEVFFHHISQRIKELERHRSRTANDAKIQVLGNRRLLDGIKSCLQPISE